tara:strand:+ start:575 stop:823 length:249 start_codon:yes stop_codon:yes gene_type:complete
MKIDKNIPLPKKITGSKRREDETHSILCEMEVGDSVFHQTKEDGARMRGRVYSYTKKNYKDFGDKDFTIRECKGGYRVFRIK